MFLNNSFVNDPDHPAMDMTQHAANKFCQWLSAQTGHYYRLPSSSEWEYAARAGTTTVYSWGNEVSDNMASCRTCKSEFSGTVAPVKSFPPNGWGLYDMHGNVWEWTKDCIDPNMAPPGNGMPVLFGNCDIRELRGGSAQSDVWSIRASARRSPADLLGFIPIGLETSISFARIKSGVPTLPTFQWPRASCTCLPSWTGTPERSWPGSSRIRWIRASVCGY